MTLSSQFVFVTCQVGAERALKGEVARAHPLLRPAFARPGFITFRSASSGGAAVEEITARWQPNAALARTSGVVVGRVDASTNGHERRLAATLDILRAVAAHAEKPLVLHVFGRDLHPPGKGSEINERRAADALARSLRVADSIAGSCLSGHDTPKVGELVADVIMVDSDVWYVGAHQHDRERSPYSGGIMRADLPPQAPSRAYLKLVEAISTLSIPVRASDTAVEVGSAPGGAAYGLLERGIDVVAIDPADMDSSLFDAKARGATLRHLRKRARQVKLSDLPRRVDWLLLDINAEPNIALSMVAPLADGLRRTLLGMIFTLKINDWSIVNELPRHSDRIKSFGAVRVVLRQLGSHNHDLVAYGVTKLGMERDSQL